MEYLHNQIVNEMIALTVHIKQGPMTTGYKQLSFMYNTNGGITEEYVEFLNDWIRKNKNDSLHYVNLKILSKQIQHISNSHLGEIVRIENKTYKIIDYLDSLELYCVEEINNSVWKTTKWVSRKCFLFSHEHT